MAILIAGIIGAVTVPVFIGQRKRANLAVSADELTQLEWAIHAARINADKPLRLITGSGWTSGACDAANNPSGIWTGDLPKTHVCWTNYLTSLQRIEAAAGLSLPHLEDGDVNGAPYMINENEGESPSLPCAKDQIGIFVDGGKTAGMTTAPGQLFRPSDTYFTLISMTTRYVAMYDPPAGC